MQILFFIVAWILVLVLFAVLLLLLLWMFTGMKNKVPFVPVPNSILPSIYKNLHLAPESVVYDLGCGDGRVLTYLANHQPKARYVGIENAPFPFLMARVLAWWNKKRGKGEMEIRYKNFFDQDLSDATHIFIYLYPNIMDALLGKFERELAPGTILLSTTFKFTQKPPIAEIDLQRKKHQLARKLFIYEF